MRFIFLWALFLLTSMNSFSQKQTSIDLKKSIAAGMEIYSINCQSCHQENGEGIEGIYPPLALSDFMMADKVRTINLILNGISGPIKVNGKPYEGDMQGYPLTDQEVSDLMNFLWNSLGNKGGTTTASEVALTRKK